MNNILEKTNNISNEIIQYIEEDLASYFNPSTYVPAAKKGLKGLERFGKKVLGDKMYKVIGEPEVGGWQKPGVLDAIAAMMAPQLTRSALEKGTFMGASQGALGGGALGGALGLYAGSKGQWGKNMNSGGTAKTRAARALYNLGIKGIRSALGAGFGTVAGTAAGGVAGGLHGRAGGSAILGGAALATPLALAAAAAPAVGGLAIPAGIAAAATLGGAVGSDVMKKVWDVRGQAAQGGPTDSVFSSSPVSRRTGR